MKMKLLAAAASAAALLAAAGSASATQYITQLVYDQTNNVAPQSYGQVTITTFTGGAPGTDYVDVQVQLNSVLAQKFVDTGGHVMFAFNLVDDPTESTVTFVNPASLSGLSFTPDVSPDQGVFQNFTDAIQYNFDGKGNGNNSLVANPLEFQVHNTGGQSFLTNGTDATFTSTVGGSPTTFNLSGGGTQTFTGGWWFSADILGTNGQTFTVAGRDFCTVGVNCAPGVPEPTTWALMIMGFGGLGAAMRQRRKAAVATA